MFECRFLEEVLDTTLSLLAIHYSTVVGAPAHMTPIHYLALVDTKAYWFKKWMVGISQAISLVKSLELEWINFICGALFILKCLSISILAWKLQQRTIAENAAKVQENSRKCCASLSGNICSSKNSVWPSKWCIRNFIKRFQWVKSQLILMFHPFYISQLISTRWWTI